MDDTDKVSAVFDQMVDETDGDQRAAALLTACVFFEQISARFFERASHDLCLGIRHGLFGVDAGANDSIKDLVYMLKEDD